MEKKRKQIQSRYDARFERDVWSVFKVMGEFVDGYEKMSNVGPCVSIFGSARLKPDNRYYEMAVEVSKQLAEIGFGIITGGGPGIMEAGNKGADLAGGTSVGLCISLPFEDTNNPYIGSDYKINFNYFFARKVMFVKYAQGFIVLPGGMGTLDEFYEAMTLIQTKKIHQFPIIMMGKEYWGGLIDWMKKTMVEEKTIDKSDLDLFHVTDDPEEAVNIIYNFYETNKLRPNF
ncbi:TIGR00730 family Rossman fold protein [Balneolaceae bacterium ANBcel3]|nr:TIGR00730 family Rossman fold protein [Balneolaceae bacterium ANBcel3]